MRKTSDRDAPWPRGRVLEAESQLLLLADAEPGKMHRRRVGAD